MLRKIFRQGPVKTILLKLRMIFDIAFHNWNIAPLSGLVHYKEFYQVNEDEVKRVFADLDALSVEEAVKFIIRQKNFYINEYNKDYFLYNHRKMFGPVRPYYKQHKKELKKYKCDFSFGGIESLVFHHGLKECPLTVSEYMKGGVFIDAGGCLGDSSLVFFKYYSPGKVITFEPLASNRQIYVDLMKKNQIPENKYDLLPYGLGNTEQSYSCNISPSGVNSVLSQEKDGECVEVKKLDSILSAEDADNVRLIKADIEGMGLEMLLGAEKIIRKNRPVLSLCIYHNQDEFFGIYKTLKNWNLNYKVIIRHVNPTTANELTLIAWPDFEV